MNDTIFLKLGGSVITDKDKPHTARLDQIDKICAQISRFVAESPQVRLLIGHGSGSFGHVAAKKQGTRAGVTSVAQWHGFLEVWREAHALHEILMQHLAAFGLPVMGFPLSAAGIAESGKITLWPVAPIANALDHHLIPVIMGDVVFDTQIGGTILSTEEQMKYLVPSLQPARILLAGNESGVWQDFPACTKMVEKINRQNYSELARNIFGSASTDVTGGMASKVAEMMTLIQEYPQLQGRIFSGCEENAVYNALIGEPIGTVLTNN